MSPRKLARLTGALYLYIMVAALFAQVFVRDRLVAGAAVVTAHYIDSSETLWRWGVAADVSTSVCDVAIAGLLLILLRPVNRAIALNAAFFRLAFSTVMAANCSLLIAPLLLLKANVGGPARK